MQYGCTPLRYAAAAGATPLLAAALLADPRVEVNAKDEVRGGRSVKLFVRCCLQQS